MPYPIQLKRAYAPPSPEDGFRILVDRLWPRGVSREKLALDLWDKDVTPSTQIRKAFRHEAERFEAFRSAYLMELSGNPAAPPFAALVRDKLKSGPVTLVYAARDETVNHARVLKEWLEGQM